MYHLVMNHPPPPPPPPPPLLLLPFLKKEVFIWSDSELKDVYSINYELTWAEQKDNIVTKLLPPLYKLVNKKYKVSNSDLLKMLYGRWRSRHRKKKRRTNAANYLIQNKDKYICRYPEKDLVQILKDSGYHSEEWEETDEDDEDDENDEEEVVTKKNSIYIYERWWRSPALQRLLHNRIDPTVELLRKKPPNLKCKRVLDKTETVSVPPAGAPSWCLNREALEKFNRLTKNIPVYDYDTDESIIQDNNGADDDVDNNVVNNKNNNKRKKKKNKSKSKNKKSKK
ncbi:hypothetical protein GLOIN_2v1489320 [Rhizophagus irregularis DAOM 181602=DAOM 197198]|uniref:Uncharacterized protein n=1 Tax=Rhizophagus irregularis (strain DAOM 181602 / DAOM 197198 / MUCL 43194) TaxID=747089 RepID=A0A2P4NU27_RHIID|nr:hypothetical protein GLOIN_2v1489320 [Rhizophagus irregularis DAOM 181602=DAOM 197198]POG56629.1 hypothetical protein GLOIN_2v1489320 [Rhizophagus irregularis DAOM 181602=DAOM 197198]GBC11014.2 hypothetical protein GLOIN_2v1489320 [Rhizophagus irregularis DAOM 181602=DAOM 197198]GBC12595.2 hypothetical protein GLOIN_2v1489320 [Rhizophagus irregularis DAOM 181602=DAOM 197198]GBC19579.2 hypothetical protein GLOIN_2v1489320 [Rhizophagus irregularis DAOM 181602=DAOM 197198]GBC36217.2 hypothetic|eukprot:XP_025164353.1 hypothetical protein GLOIN_2v1489320 [Rhizophagus irregularis DAOM 181602=DAOM 197198]